MNAYAHMCRMDHEEIGHNDSEHEDCPLCRMQNERDAIAERCEKLREALRVIGAWDCLNPPRADLLADLPWLRQVVDAALATPKDAP